MLQKKPDDREYDFTITDFNKIRKMIYEHAGISLADSKTDMVYSRIGRRVRATGNTSFKDYLVWLENANNAKELEAFINSLTTNLTSFFREQHHFPILSDFLKKSTGKVRIWCSAASTGEEPYSIAMTACQALGTLKPNVEIIATDIDTNVLDVASKGIYANERVEALQQSQLKEFFRKGSGDNEGYVKVIPELVDLIEFRKLNLLDPVSHWGMKEPLDIIFCRNVMIYFDKETQTSILKKFAPLMSKNGLLFAGHSENFTYVSNEFKLLGKTVYGLNK